ncbi:MAG: GNAT family N-acetyltransferase [Acidimicrobiales bacterium]|nr:GNAT family N-acetyltransferase [Acidimicrobiales bacterium]
MNPEALVLEVPDLSTEQIRLRPWRVDDAPSLSRAWHDPAIIAGSTPPADCSVAAAARWIEGCDERRRAGVAFDLVIAAASDERVLGEVGFSRFDADRLAVLMGWWVHEEARGAGVATAAVSLVVEWVLASTWIDHVLAEIGEENHASQAVARSAGFAALKPGVWCRSLPSRSIE